MSRHDVTVTVNGEQRRASVEPLTLLVHLLREDLGVTSTHVGCDTTQCGACTVHLDGRAVKACTVLAVQADGAAVDTIESLSRMDDGVHPLLAAAGRWSGWTWLPAPPSGCRYWSPTSHRR
jgi:carbon-monoxide dehydrogenase small subunit